MTDTIYYFSGTGNSRYVAHMLGKELGVRVRHITDPMLPDVNEERESGISSEQNSVGLVFPVYSWGVPPLVLDFIDRLSALDALHNAGMSLWAVMTCGDETAMAPEMLCKRASRRGLRILGIWSVIMPNNYVFLPGFNVDPKPVEIMKLHAAPNRIRHIAELVKRKEWTFDVTRGSWPRLKTRLIYPLFKRLGIFPRKWKSDSACIGCGRCEAVCPMGNILLKSGHPVWGDNCVSCVACYHICPVRAIDYGNLTKGKGQYFCPTNEE